MCKNPAHTSGSAGAALGAAGAFGMFGAPASVTIGGAISVLHQKIGKVHVAALDFGNVLVDGREDLLF